MTAWTWSSVADAFITIIICRSPEAMNSRKGYECGGGRGSPEGFGARSLQDPGWSARRGGAAGRERLAKSPGAIGEVAGAGEGGARGVRPGGHGYEGLLVPDIGRR